MKKITIQGIEEYGRKLLLTREKREAIKSKNRLIELNLSRKLSK